MSHGSCPIVKWLLSPKRGLEPHVCSHTSPTPPVILCRCLLVADSEAWPALREAEITVFCLGSESKGQPGGAAFPERRGQWFCKRGRQPDCQPLPGPGRCQLRAHPGLLRHAEGGVQRALRSCRRLGLGLDRLSFGLSVVAGFAHLRTEPRWSPMPTAPPRPRHFTDLELTHHPLEPGSPSGCTSLTASWPMVLLGSLEAVSVPSTGAVLPASPAPS